MVVLFDEGGFRVLRVRVKLLRKQVSRYETEKQAHDADHDHDNMQGSRRVNDQLLSDGAPPTLFSLIGSHSGSSSRPVRISGSIESMSFSSIEFAMISFSTAVLSSLLLITVFLSKKDTITNSTMRGIRETDLSERTNTCSCLLGPHLGSGSGKT
jgi:hypothetical protein